MAMLDSTKLRQVFRAKLRAAGGDLANIRMAHENRKLKLKKDAALPAFWIRETLMIFDESKSSTGTIEADGDMIYDVLGLKSKGTEEIEALAKLVAEAFEAGQSLTATGIEVSLEKSRRFPGLDDPGENSPGGSIWFYIPVHVQWRVFTAAATA